MPVKPILTVLLVLCTISSFAQDKIYKRNRSVIDGKVLKVTSGEVSYKKADNPDGPEYIIPLREVDRIVYQDGSEDKRMPGTPHMRHRKARADVAPKSFKPEDYKNNIVALSLLNISDAGMTMGLSYERVLDKKGIISFYLPFAYYLKSWGNDNDYQIAASPFGELNRTARITEFRPAVKIYPFNARGKVRYAVGPQFSYTEGWVHRNYFMRGSSFKVEQQRMGLLLNQSLMLHPTPHIYIGAELGFGYTFSNKQTDVIYGPFGDVSPGTFREQGTTELAHFGFSIGYRF